MLRQGMRCGEETVRDGGTKNRRRDVVEEGGRDEHPHVGGLDPADLPAQIGDIGDAESVVETVGARVPEGRLDVSLHAVHFAVGGLHLGRNWWGIGREVGEIEEYTAEPPA